MSGRRVLIVDADDDSRRVYRAVLQHYGYHVVDTADGQEAVQLAGEHEFDVVVTELMVRRLDGQTLLRRLQSDDRTRTLCVIVLTAQVVPPEQEHAVRRCCTRFMTKPVQPNELLQTIRGLIDGDGAN